MSTASNLAAAFGAGGALERHLPGYRPREQQVEFAEAVHEAIESGSVLVAEAGTGTGKTFAYLVPALLAGGRVIISTGTKTLQDQLFHRDLPLVRRALGVPVDVALLKGRANYVCLHHLEHAATQGTFASREDTVHIHRIRSFAAQTMTGDRGDCAGVPENAAAWSQATSTRENCLGSGCRYYADCFVMKARKRAADAEVVVVNHHLFFADLALRDEGAGELLGAANTLIFDEAHHLPDLARLFFGQSISTAQALELARDVRLTGAEHAKESADFGNFASSLERAARDVRLALGQALGRTPLASVRDKPAFDRALDDLAAELGRCEALLKAHEERAEEIRNARERASLMLSRVVEWREADERPESAWDDEKPEKSLVRWVEAFPQSAVLYVTPLDVAPIFRAQIDADPRAWIFTSATLSVDGDFSHFQSEMGLAEARTVSWPSPFDFANQALLYVPEGLPEPNTEGYVEAVVAAAWPVIRASGGHAFVLFTALRAMERGFEKLQARLRSEGLDWPLLLQGSASKNDLLERFRRSPNAILVGSQTFWEGVDVKGEQLSVVVIDKLPFNPPDDPVLAACIERIQRAGGNAFMEYQLPRAVITLKQGAGRLIRDETDRGTLMICDPRLVEKPYGRRIWRSLPPFKRTRSLADVEAFFAPKLVSEPGTTEGTEDTEEARR